MGRDVADGPEVSATHLRTAAELERLATTLEAVDGELAEEVRKGLDSEPTSPWTTPVDEVAGKLVNNTN